LSGGSKTADPRSSDARWRGLRDDLVKDALVARRSRIRHEEIGAMLMPITPPEAFRRVGAGSKYAG